jgi:uncharacterized membrane protein YsdA (DUF1294 family)
MGHQVLTAYLVLVNAAALALMLVDKQKARRSAWRIPETTLMGVALIGGSLGAIAGMYLFHHKTRHLKFTLGLPLILAVQVWLLTVLK